MWSFSWLIRLRRKLGISRNSRSMLLLTDLLIHQAVKPCDLKWAFIFMLSLDKPLKHISISNHKQPKPPQRFKGFKKILRLWIRSSYYNISKWDTETCHVASSSNTQGSGEVRAIMLLPAKIRSCWSGISIQLRILNFQCVHKIWIFDQTLAITFPPVHKSVLKILVTVLVSQNLQLIFICFSIWFIINKRKVQ